MNRKDTKTKIGPTHYQIIVSGELSEDWADWLGEVLFESHCQSNNPRETTIIGVVPDQAALRGLLNKLWDLNLILISVNLHDN